MGLYVGWQAPKRLTPETHLQSHSFWQTQIFLLDSLLFVLIGLQFPAILEGLQERSVWEVLFYTLLESSTRCWNCWRRELFEAERASILSLCKEGKIRAEVIRRTERDIDLKELRFSG
jgi:hypothetical protein